MEEKTLWERTKRKFENSPIGVFILGFLLLTSVAYNWYSNYKTEQKNNQSEKIEEKIDETNKELLAINNLLIKHMRFRGRELDSTTIILNNYLIVRNSITEHLHTDVKIKEGELKDSLFKEAFIVLTSLKTANGITNERYKKVKLKQFCNQIIDFCEKTMTCSEAHIKTLKITIDELDKNN